MSSWSITSTSIPKKHGEVVSSFRCVCSPSFIFILPFCGVVFDHQAAYADRVRYPSKLHTSHPKADVPRLKAGSTINPSGHSQTLLPMGHSSQTSVLCVVHMEKKPYLHYTCLFHPWFTPRSSSIIHIYSKILSSPNLSLISLRISENSPFMYFSCLKPHSTKFHPIIFAAGETSALWFSPKQELSSLFAGFQTFSASNTIEALILDQLFLPSSNAFSSEALLLGLENLGPYMEFGNLGHLCLNIEWNIDMTDSDVLALASGCPGWNIS